MAAVSKTADQKPAFAILYEDENLILVRKDHGLTVHPTDRQKTLDPQGKTLVEQLVKMRPSLAGVGPHPLRPGLVHRLDRETSGLLLIAKTNQSLYNLQRLFRRRRIEKTYYALVCGRLKFASRCLKGCIYRSLKNPSRRGWLPQNRSTPRTLRQSKLRPAETIIIPRAFYRNRRQTYTYVELRPKTGRTHQLRVQLHGFGHPIAGDPLYRRQNCPPPQGLNRLFLHASGLRFKLGKTEYDFTDPLPSSLKRCLAQLSLTA